LIELQDFVDGIPGRNYCYGVLRFREPLEPSVEQRLLSATRLTLRGGGIQATLCLYKLNSFTVISANEISVDADRVAA
jgi:hypothetical protein